MGIFADATAALGQTLSEHEGVAVTYHVGASSASVTAVPGRSSVDVDEGDGVVVQVKSHDWIVRAVDLVVGGNTVTPSGGHRVKRVLNGVTSVYQVMNGVPYRPCDAGGTRLRIHTQYIGTE